MSMAYRNRSKARARGRRSRPGIEGLEQRLALAVAAAVVDGQLQVNGTGAADTIILDHNGTATNVVGVGFFEDVTITKGIAINAGAGNDTINIRATSRALTINAQAGADTVNVGKAGSVLAILNPVTITSNANLVDLNVDDSADPVARTVTMDVANGVGTIKGLAPATISYPDASLRLLSVKGGGGGNTFTVANTTRPGGGSLTTITTGGLHDTINVLRTSGPLKLDDKGGDANVVVGLNNSLESIAGGLDVLSSFGGTFLVLRDAADATPDTVTVARDATTGLMTVAGLAPVAITLKGSGGLVLDAGSGGNTFTIDGSTGETTLFSGAGNDTFNVLATSNFPTGRMLITGGAGINTVNVGRNGGVQEIRERIDVLQVANLVVDDSNDAVSRNATVAVKAGTAEGSVIGLSPAAITFNSANLKSLVVNGGLAGNTFTVDTFGDNSVFPFTLNSGLAADTVHVQRGRTPLTINGQAGQDTVNVGLNGVMAFLDAAVTVTNTGGRTALNLNDQGDVLPRAVTLADSGLKGTVSGLGTPTITYVQNDLRSLTINGGIAGNTFAVSNTFGGTFATIPTTINAGAGDDVVTVQRTTQPLIINGQAGTDTVNLGLNNSVQGLLGAVSVRHATTGGSIALFVNNQADATGRAVSLDTTIGGDVVFVGTITGLAPAPIDCQTSVVRELRIRAGTGADTFNVLDTAGNGLGLITKLDAGGGDDTVNIRRTSGPIDVNTQGGSNAVNFGSIQDFTGTTLGSVNVVSTGGSTALTINDQGSNFGHANVTLSSRNVGGVVLGDIAGQLPGGALISYVAAEVGALTLNANPAGNSFTIRDTVAGSTALNTGTGFDSIHIHGTSKPVTINGQSGLDNVIVGEDATVQGIKGELTILNTGSRSQVIVDDRVDPGKRNVTMGIGNGFGTIAGLAPALIKYDVDDVSNIFVDAGNAGNTFTVQDTIDNGVKPTTTISTGTGVDIVNVQRTTGALTINGQNGRDTINVGLSNSVQSIRGTLNITNAGSFSAINLNDQADTAGRPVTLGTNPGANQGSIIGLAPAVILYRLGDLGTLTINGGLGADTFKISGTANNGGGPANTVVNAGGGADSVGVFATTGPLTVNAGGGNDSVTIGSTFNTLDPIQGVVAVNGQADGDTLTLNDQGSTSVHVYNVTPTQVQRLGAATITYSGIENLKVNKGPTPTGPLVKNLGFKDSIRRGELAKLTGRLADPDAADRLALSVDWGDGSTPARSTPDRVPFALKHRFAKPGVYTVRVIWRDSTGESNFRDLRLAVKATETGRSALTTRAGSPRSSGSASRRR